MSFQYKKQEFQTKAVNSINNIFKGHYSSQNSYTISSTNTLWDETYFKNSLISLTEEEILQNIQSIQKENEIPISNKLYKKEKYLEFDIEMETGTGKTFVYLNSIFELNKEYNFSKFIIVVPTIAIREGVIQSIKSTKDYFYSNYQKHLNAFVFDSKNIGNIKDFSRSNEINVMIINTQAFNSENNLINNYSEKFSSKKPIEWIADNNPILIIDEPQKVEGKKTRKYLNDLNPLFTLNFSATHKTKHNLIYLLNSIDAYNQKLVKSISVYDIVIKNIGGENSYLNLEDIIVSPNKPPMVRLEYEVLRKNHEVNKESKLLKVKDDLYPLSNNLEQYKSGYIITNISANTNSITFQNGIELKLGHIQANNLENEKFFLRRAQIKKAIEVHLQKEEDLFVNHQIKTLSLFFIDEVKKYRDYTNTQNKFKGEYADFFEKEYIKQVKELIDNPDTNLKYKNYLKHSLLDVSKIHNGYFAKDKHGHFMNSEDTEINKKKKASKEDIETYDLILKDKERLLSLVEPTRFIFSHSALREGWDNPNIFQICFLKDYSNEMNRKQEIGRGLRLSVNKNLVRMDYEVLGEEVQDVNELSIIIDEDYSKFIKNYQNELFKEITFSKTFNWLEISKNFLPLHLDLIFKNKIESALINNDYLDKKGNFTQKLLEDIQLKQLQGFDFLENDDFINFLQKETKINNTIKHANKVIRKNQFNEEQWEKFEKFWDLIKYRYSYKVNFNQKLFIERMVNNINYNLSVKNVVLSSNKIKSLKHSKGNDLFDLEQKEEEILNSNIHLENENKYDLIGKIKERTGLIAKTIKEVLTSIKKEKFNLFKKNPVSFIENVSYLINEIKSQVIVEDIKYKKREIIFEKDEIFETKENLQGNIFESEKSIFSLVNYDGGKNSVEEKFIKSLEQNINILTYTKLPKKFYIETPLGKYSPDWAIVYKDKNGKETYFIVETKGSNDRMDLRFKEAGKIKCAQKLFSLMENVEYFVGTKLGDILSKI